MQKDMESKIHELLSAKLKALLGESSVLGVKYAGFAEQMVDAALSGDAKVWCLEPSGTAVEITV